MPTETMQQTLIDTPAFQALSVTFVKETNILLVPDDPVVLKAYKQQQMLTRMERMMEKQPGQVNIAVYQKTLDDFIANIQKIKNGANDSENSADANDHREPTRVGDTSAGGDTEAVDARELTELDMGIPTKNPFSR